MAGANLATPLYAVYAHTFGFSSLVLTTVFATYAVVLVPALILFGYLNAQEELNAIAAGARRGEVTAAFIGCIYFLVAAGVIATGLLDLRFSLARSVGAVALALAASAVVSAARSATAASTSR
jgi:hypothetical protein